MDFPKKLKQAREAMGISQTELAKRVGLSRSAICRYEKGHRTKITVPIAVNIAKCLGVDLLEEIQYNEAMAMPDEEFYMLTNASAEIQNSKLHNEEYRKRKAKLLNGFDKLSARGQNEAVKRIEELTFLDEYKSPIAKLEDK